MMKVVKYKICTLVNRGTEESPAWEEVLSFVEMGWNEENEKIAKQEAYRGEYTVEEDSQPESAPVVTADDVLNTLLGVTG